MKKKKKQTIFLLHIRCNKKKDLLVFSTGERQKIGYFLLNVCTCGVCMAHGQFKMT